MNETNDNEARHPDTEPAPPLRHCVVCEEFHTCPECGEAADRCAHQAPDAEADAFRDQLIRQYARYTLPEMITHALNTLALSVAASCSGSEQTSRLEVDGTHTRVFHVPLNVARVVSSLTKPVVEAMQRRVRLEEKPVDAVTGVNGDGTVEFFVHAFAANLIKCIKDAPAFGVQVTTASHSCCALDVTFTFETGAIRDAVALAVIK